MTVNLYPNFSSVKILDDYIGQDHARYPRPIALPLTFFNSLPFIEQEHEVNLPRVFKELLQYPKNFIYEGKSVYERFQGVFDTIAVLEKEVERLEEEGSNDDALEGTIDEIKRSLQESIKLDFLDFLKEELGDDRLHLIPDILSKFSLIASTSIATQLSLHTQKEFNSVLQGPANQTQRKIELRIPAQGSVEPVEIISDLSAVYEEQRAQAAVLKLNPKIQMIAQGVFSIPLKGQTQHDVGIILKPF